MTEFDVREPYQVVKMITLEKAIEGGHISLVKRLERNLYLAGSHVIMYRDVTFGFVPFDYFKIGESMYSLYDYMWEKGTEMSLDEAKIKHSSLFI